MSDLLAHSAGGHHGLGVALLESEYFAAVTVQAGILNEMTLSYTPWAKRKIPFAIWQGLNPSPSLIDGDGGSDPGLPCLTPV